MAEVVSEVEESVGRQDGCEGCMAPGDLAVAYELAGTESPKVVRHKTWLKDEGNQDGLDGVVVGNILCEAEAEAQE
jgi:hypothetical protein